MLGPPRGARAASRSGRRGRRRGRPPRSICRTSWRRCASKVSTWAITLPSTKLSGGSQSASTIRSSQAPRRSMSRTIASHRPRDRLVPRDQGRRVGAAPLGQVGALDRREPDLLGPHQVVQHRSDRLLRTLPGGDDQAGHPRLPELRRASAAWRGRAAPGCRRRRGGRAGRPVGSWVPPRCAPTATWADGSGCRWAPAASGSRLPRRSWSRWAGGRTRGRTRARSPRRTRSRPRTPRPSPSSRDAAATRPARASPGGASPPGAHRRPGTAAG